MKRLRNALISILMTFACLEVSLKLIDPIGIARYYQDSGVLLSRIVPNEDGYDFTSGVMDMYVYDATIQLSGERYTPSAIGTGCRVATVGDSLTFGMGVYDDETFTELLAQEYAGNWVNRGKPGYNSGNILADVNSFDADMIVYLATNNDPDSDWFYSRPNVAGYQSALQAYTWQYTFRNRMTMGTTYTPQFEYNIASISSNENLLMFVMSDNPQLTVYRAYGAIVIPPYRGVVSIADTHPNKQGHRELFNYLLPYVMRGIDEYCHI